MFSKRSPRKPFGSGAGLVRIQALLTLIGAWLLVFLAPHAFLAQANVTSSASKAVAPASDEVRALWVVRTTLTSKDKIRELVKRASSNGFNTLIVQVRGRGDAYYRSLWEPRAATLKEQDSKFDPLAFTLKEAKRKKLKVHAWVNTNLLANLDELPQEQDHIFNARPEWLAVPRAVAGELYSIAPTDARYRTAIVEWSKQNRGELEGVYVGPSQPEVREHIYSIWMDLLSRYDVDGLHFDYVRFASPDFDYSRRSLAQFRLWLEPHLSENDRLTLNESLKSEPLAATVTYPDRFAEFQRQQVTSLVERIFLGVKKRRPSLIVSAAVFANDENAFTRRFQDWRRWLEMGVLDVVCPMAYSTDTAVFSKQIEVARAAANKSGRRVWAGIGAYRITSDSTVEKINAARAAGADGVILFSYDAAIKPGPLNPNGDYLERVRRAAFDVTSPVAKSKHDRSNGNVTSSN